MGMIFVARRLTAAQLDRLRADPSLTQTLLSGGSDDDADPDDHVDLDKAWHGIHFLLTGTTWEIPAGDGEAILGGDPIGPDLGYGPARLVPAERVLAVAAVLRGVDVDALRARFDPAELEANDIYPNIWDDPGEFDTYLAPNFAALRAFYQRAADRQQAVLVVIN